MVGLLMGFEEKIGPTSTSQCIFMHTGSTGFTLWLCPHWSFCFTKLYLSMGQVGQYTAYDTIDLAAWSFSSKSFDKQHQWFFLVSKICHQTVIIMSICTKDKNSRQARKNIFQIDCSCGKSLLDKIIQERFSISKSVAAPRAQVVQNSFYPARHCRPSLHSNFCCFENW